MNVNVGSLIRLERQKLGMSLRELARRVGVSASMLSQVENDRTHPSVSTIYAIATELGLSIDALLSGRSELDGAAQAPDAAAGNGTVPAVRIQRGDGRAAAVLPAAGVPATAAPTTGVPAAGAAGTGAQAVQPGSARVSAQLVGPEQRRKLELESGVTWELLSDLLPHLVDFMYVTYEPGGSSSSSGKMMRHTGTEFAYLLRGELKIHVGFEEYVLRQGDALAFDSSEPHLLVNEGTEPAEGVWFVLGRRTGSAPALPDRSQTVLPVGPCAVMLSGVSLAEHNVRHY